MKGHLRFHCHRDDEGAVHCYRRVVVLCGHDPEHPHARRAESALARLLGAAPRSVSEARAG